MLEARLKVGWLIGHGKTDEGDKGRVERETFSQVVRLREVDENGVARPCLE